MTERLATRIYAEHYNLIKQLPDEEQGRVIMALLDIAFEKSKIQNENQIEIKNKFNLNNFDFLSPLAKSIISAILPQMKIRTMRAGGARKGAGRPRKSGNVQNLHNPEKSENEKKSKIQNENQIEIKNKFNLNNFEKSDANARVVDNNINNNINNIYPEKENISLTGYAKEKAPANNWDRALQEWNRIAGLYRRPKCRAITPALQKSISARCKENKLHLSDFMAVCEKALAGDKAMRCGTDNWGGADLVYFSRSANFTRALQIADNPAASKPAARGTSETYAILADFITKGE